MGSIGIASAPAAAVAPTRYESVVNTRFSGLSFGNLETTTISTIRRVVITAVKMRRSRIMSPSHTYLGSRLNWDAPQASRARAIRSPIDRAVLGDGVEWLACVRTCVQSTLALVT